MKSISETICNPKVNRGDEIERVRVTLIFNLPRIQTPLDREHDARGGRSSQSQFSRLPGSGYAARPEDGRPRSEAGDEGNLAHTSAPY